MLTGHAKCLNSILLHHSRSLLPIALFHLMNLISYQVGYWNLQWEDNFTQNEPVRAARAKLALDFIIDWGSQYFALDLVFSMDHHYNKPFLYGESFERRLPHKQVISHLLPICVYILQKQNKVRDEYSDWSLKTIEVIEEAYVWVTLMIQHCRLR